MSVYDCSVSRCEINLTVHSVFARRICWNFSLYRDEDRIAGNVEKCPARLDIEPFVPHAHTRIPETAADKVFGKQLLPYSFELFRIQWLSSHEHTAPPKWRNGGLVRFTVTIPFFFT
ncbi:MAG: hypothetical protein A4E35_01128 [Methanoregula sp. PtaU1.Bin051]|nr:MAG: hypothetical protein A4E35_01128 [Methanoregula sp. PtaU1.Bin051]